MLRGVLFRVGLALICIILIVYAGSAFYATQAMKRAEKALTLSTQPELIVLDSSLSNLVKSLPARDALKHNAPMMTVYSSDFDKDPVAAVRNNREAFHQALAETQQLLREAAELLDELNRTTGPRASGETRRFAPGVGADHFSPGALDQLATRFALRAVIRLEAGEVTGAARDCLRIVQIANLLEGRSLGLYFQRLIILKLAGKVGAGIVSEPGGVYSSADFMTLGKHLAAASDRVSLHRLAQAEYWTLPSTHLPLSFTELTWSERVLTFPLDRLMAAEGYEYIATLDAVAQKPHAVGVRELEEYEEAMGMWTEMFPRYSRILVRTRTIQAQLRVVALGCFYRALKDGESVEGVRDLIETQIDPFTGERLVSRLCKDGGRIIYSVGESGAEVMQYSQTESGPIDCKNAVMALEKAKSKWLLLNPM